MERGFRQHQCAGGDAYSSAFDCSGSTWKPSRRADVALGMDAAGS